MLIENDFEVNALPAHVLCSLTDVAQVAGCFPGAQLTEVVNETTYAGEVKVRLGPVSVTFAGQMELTRRDESEGIAAFRATAGDRKGRGNLEAEITMQITPASTGSHVHVSSEVQLAGAIAQYGRGVGMIKRLAARNVEQFAAALAQQLEADSGAVQGEQS